MNSVSSHLSINCYGKFKIIIHTGFGLYILFSSYRYQE